MDELSTGNRFDLRRMKLTLNDLRTHSWLATAARRVTPVGSMYGKCTREKCCEYSVNHRCDLWTNARVATTNHHCLAYENVQGGKFSFAKGLPRGVTEEFSEHPREVLAWERMRQMTHSIEQGFSTFIRMWLAWQTKRGPVAHGLHNSSNALSRSNNKFC